MGKYTWRKKNLGLVELIAIAIGGMVGGGIFSILGISAQLVGYVTPVAILIGGILAFFAAYSYVKLGVYYKDEGATYAFVKRSFPDKPVAASFIGWYVIFGYISTLSLYAYTFASYALSGTDYAGDVAVRKTTALGIITVFTLINVWSVKGMGKIEDFMVYLKLAILFVVSILLATHGQMDFDTFASNMWNDFRQTPLLQILIVSSLTFVAYEGFQLVINAVNEMPDPSKNIPRAIYSAIGIVLVIYLVLAVGALFAIPLDDLIKGKEYALAAGASQILGKTGEFLIIFGALLATSSAISGTVFGSSRQMSAIAEDGFMPRYLVKRNAKNIPVNAIVTMAVLASSLILAGGLRLILEFGSITFLLVSFLIAAINFRDRRLTGASPVITVMALAGLGIGTILILYYEAVHKPKQMLFILFIYILLSAGAWFFVKDKTRRS
jgi:amino acid transporter